MRSPLKPPFLETLILAGGISSRMGQDKALIPLNGIPLLRKIYETAQTCTEQVYIITPWIERYQPILPSHCHFILETPLPGETLPHGALIGFSQGLTHLTAEWVLLLACDLPQLQAHAFQDWVSQLYNVSAETQACLARNPKGWEPLCGFYRRRCLPSLSSYIHQGGRSFQPWLAHQTIQELIPQHPEILFNCNTPADLQTLSEI